MQWYAGSPHRGRLPGSHGRGRHHALPRVRKWWDGDECVAVIIRRGRDVFLEEIIRVCNIRLSERKVSLI
jgi:hypothetical protein